MLPAFAAEAAAKAQPAQQVRLPRYKSRDTGCCSQSNRLLGGALGAQAAMLGTICDWRDLLQ